MELQKILNPKEGRKRRKRDKDEKGQILNK